MYITIYNCIVYEQNNNSNNVVPMLQNGCPFCSCTKCDIYIYIYVSVLFTELHKHAYISYCSCDTKVYWLWHIVMGLWHSIAGPNIVYSLPISELHECASLHCFVVVRKGHCFPTNYHDSSVKSLKYYLHTTFRACRYSGLWVTQICMYV